MLVFSVGTQSEGDNVLHPKKLLLVCMCVFAKDETKAKWGWKGTSF